MVTTGDKTHASTDANVFIQFVGEKYTSGKLRLDEQHGGWWADLTKSTVFERGR